MKKEIVFLILIISLILPTTLAEQTPNPIDSLSQPKTDSTKPNLNPWNETIIISDTWQKVVGTFFGLNLKGEDTAISVRETLVFISIFIMFLVIIYDIIKLTPFFKSQNLPTEFLSSLIVTILVSISGALINLKELFLKAITYTIEKLNFQFVDTALKESLFSNFITSLFVVIVAFLIWLILDTLNPIIKSYSKISRAEAVGRKLRSSVE